MSSSLTTKVNIDKLTKQIVDSLKPQLQMLGMGIGTQAQTFSEPDFNSNEAIAKLMVSSGKIDSATSNLGKRVKETQTEVKTNKKTLDNTLNMIKGK